ncbi:MAG: acyl--CoA ligase [Dehalococcoidia bacterium]|nr:acyl--CoA ligase [Dehalococcoidia bacterium]
MNIGHLLDSNVWQYGEYKQFIFIGNEVEQSFTNTHILDQARSLATGLKIKAVKKGDIVASVLSNIPEIPEIINGVHRMGAVYLPIIFMLTAPEIRYILEDSHCKIIITEDKLLKKVLEAAEAIKTLQTIIVIGESSSNDTVCYHELLKVSDERGDVVDVDDDDLALLMYTSGTIGYPKGVMLTHKNMYSQMKAGISVWGIDKGETLLTTVPMNTIYGVLSCMEGYVEGFTNILMPPFDPRRVLDTIKKYRVNVLPVVPTMLNFMLMVWDSIIDDISSLNLLICAGAPLQFEILQKTQNTFDVEITQGYGCTEVGGSISRQRLDWPRKPGSTGFPIPGLSVKIIDDNGNEVQRGQNGEIICKGPAVMKGYLNKTRETSNALKDGWFHTGDIGMFDNDGELYVTGRKKDIIIKGGENIDPGISENWLYKHPAVLDAAVFGVEDEKYGEEIAAAVVLKPDSHITEEELLIYLSGHVHHFMAPRRIYFIEAMPKSSIGNIRKGELRQIIDRQL